MRRLPLLAAALALSVSAGCGQPIKFERELTLTEGKMFVFDPPRARQKVTVRVTADEPVTAFILLEDDKELAETALLNRSRPGKAIAGQEDSKEIEFQAEIPAKKEYIVCLSPGKSAKKAPQVKLNVKGR